MRVLLFRPEQRLLLLLGRGEAVLLVVDFGTLVHCELLRAHRACLHQGLKPLIDPSRFPAACIGVHGRGVHPGCSRSCCARSKQTPRASCSATQHLSGAALCSRRSVLDLVNRRLLVQQRTCSDHYVARLDADFPLVVQVGERKQPVVEPQLLVARHAETRLDRLQLRDDLRVRFLQPRFRRRPPAGALRDLRVKSGAFIFIWVAAGRCCGDRRPRW
mmetsp:Transcript_20866/g.52682  ORF Transcript_20866/g.52682 Transcript_20866/m.52682 type:complete len:217 (+) Transcript_20866:4028-4678(+)